MNWLPSGYQLEIKPTFFNFAKTAGKYCYYVSIISLFDVISILDGTSTWIWKLGILVIIGATGYILGDIKFLKKDLPL